MNGTLVENLKNAGWSEIKDFPKLSIKDSNYLPYLYTKHITEDIACMSSYYKNPC